MEHKEEVTNVVSWLTTGGLNDQTILKAAKFLLSVCDLTSLNDDDSEESIRLLCGRAVRPVNTRGDMPHVAAVCVFPKFIDIAREVLDGKPVRIATVAGAFPSGDAPTDLKLAEVQASIDRRADEVDYVIDHGLFLKEGNRVVENEVREAKRICGARTLKVILETGALRSEPAIRNAAESAILGGADFVKTSTGKLAPAATISATTVMLHVISDHMLSTGKRVGIKPAGGIANMNDATEYARLVHGILGNGWLNPSLFRIGASRLLDDIVARTSGC
jgi:deoxyribose-phosphate aldolase